MDEYKIPAAGIRRKRAVEALRVWDTAKCFLTDLSNGEPIESDHMLWELHQALQSLLWAGTVYPR